LLVQARDERPALLDLEKNLSETQSLIEIPHNITSLKERNPDLAREWREATRAAFLAALESGFTVQDLVKQPPKYRPKWFYLLAR
jgi:predicted GNAT superfamily acetyltransferase